MFAAGLRTAAAPRLRAAAASPAWRRTALVAGPQSEMMAATAGRRAGCRGLRSAAALTVVAPHQRDEEEKLPHGQQPLTLGAVRSTVGSVFASTAIVTGMPVPGATLFADGGAAGPPPVLCGPELEMFLRYVPPVAAQFCFLAPMDAMKTIKATGSTGDMPLLPYAAMSVNGIGWVTYGLLANSATIWLPNITAFLFGSYYWYTYSQHSKASNVPWLVGGVGAVGAIGYLGYMQNAGVTSLGFMPGYDEPKLVLGLYLNAVVVAMFGGPLGAIKNVMATGDTSSIPFPFALATFVNCSTWAAFGILVIQDPLVWGCNILGLGSAIAQLACHAKFGINSKPAAAVEAAPAQEKAEEKAEEKK